MRPTGFVVAPVAPAASFLALVAPFLAPADVFFLFAVVDAAVEVRDPGVSVGVEVVGTVGCATLRCGGGRTGGAGYAVVGRTACIVSRGMSYKKFAT